MTTAKTKKASPSSTKIREPAAKARVGRDDVRNLKTKYTGASLEKHRLESGLTSIESAEGFGLPIAKWYTLVRPENAKKPLADCTLALTLCLYSEHPKAAPNKGTPNVADFYQWLGFVDTPADKIEFARLIGRQPASVYRLLGPRGKPSRPLIRYIEGLQRLGLDGRGTRKVMAKIAKKAYTR